MEEQLSVESVEKQAESKHEQGGQHVKGGGVSLKVLLALTLIGAAVLGVVIWSGIALRVHASNALNTETRELAVPTVSVVTPQVMPGGEEVALPGNMEAYIDTPVWARSSGYLKAWYVDIGGHVRKGQLLAEIEAPEVDQQLKQAQAQLQTAQANLKLSEVTADRYTELFKTDSVAKQDVDNAVQGQAAKQADVFSADANVSRLQQLVAYEKVEAPFSGIITARNIDVGALVNQGANTPGKELFHVASIDTMRTYVSVPEIYSQAAKPGVQAYLTLNEFPSRKFYGQVVRNANSIDESSRTLLVEVDVKNPTGELLPGSFISVHLKLPSSIPALTVPSNTLLFRSEGLRVVRVVSGKAELVPVILGRDFGDTVELVSGIRRDDKVIVNPSDSITEGQQVAIAEPGKKRN
jgi:RND family efflux transporter MFP subunit